MKRLRRGDLLYVGGGVRKEEGAAGIYVSMGMSVRDIALIVYERSSLSKDRLNFPHWKLEGKQGGGGTTMGWV